MSADDRLKRAAALLEEKRRKLDELRRTTGAGGLRPSADIRDAPAHSPSIERKQTGASDNLAVENAPTSGLSAYIASLRATASPHEPSAASRAWAVEHPVQPVSYAPAVQDDSTQRSSVPAPSAVPSDEAHLAGFLARASRLVHRALAQADYVDLTPAYVSAPASESGSASLSSLQRPDVVCSSSLPCVATRRRPDSVAGVARRLAGSSRYTELAACAYCASPLESTGQQAPSSVVIFHAKVPEAHAVLSSSELISALAWPDTLADAGSNVVIGGCESGDVWGWDIRAEASQPSLQMRASCASHALPVVSLLVPSKDDALAGNAIFHSVSADGTECVWDVRNPSRPVTCMPLCSASRFSVSSAAWYSTADDVIVYGDITGSISVTGKADKRAETAHRFERMHIGRVACLRSRGVGSEYGLVSAGVDGQLHVWTPDVRAGANGRMCVRDREFFDVHVQEAGLVCRTSFSDAGSGITDVAWSPAHAAAFLAADMTGTAFLYDLAQDVVLSVGSVSVAHGHIECVSWSADGSTAWLGDSAGDVHVARPSGLVGARDASLSRTVGALPAMEMFVLP